MATTRRTFLAGLTALASASIGCNARRSAPQPNLVFILADDLGYTDLASYGSPLHETPNLDRLASNGIRFTNAYAACPVCSPTRASIVTGKYPARLGITNYLPGRHPVPYAKLIGVEQKLFLDHSEATFAETLKSAGYRTGHFGKWHLGGKDYSPLTQGFDVAFGHTASTRSYFYPGWAGDPPIEGTEGEYVTDRLGDEAAKFIKEHSGRPFFAYLPHFAPHVPLEAKEEKVAKYKAKVQPGSRHNDPIYAAMIESLDENVGKVLDAIETAGIADNTIVIFTSDNGGLTAPEWLLKPTTSNYPLREGKGHLYEGGIRVPLIISGPGVRRGVVEDTPLSSIDHFPTLNALAGVSASVNEGIDGVSYAALLTAAIKPEERSFFWHYPHYSNQLGKPGSAIRRGDFKLIRFHEDNHVELYNLREDIGETKDLTSVQPEKVSQLAEELDAWLKSVNAKFPTENPAYDPKRESDGYWWKQPGAYERWGKR